MTETSKVLHDDKVEIRKKLKQLNTALDLLKPEQVKRLKELLSKVEVEIKLLLETNSGD